METSIFLARLMGIVCLVLGVSMLVERKMLLGIFHELAKNRTLSYVLGALILVLGLIIVLSHNIWENGFPLVITVLGLVITIEGGAYIFMSKHALEKYVGMLNNKKIYYIIAFSYCLVGSYLAAVGFAG